MQGDRPKPVRLQRLLADAGVASRRDCEALIEDGRVEVNGSIVTRLPVFVDPARDRVTVDGEPVRLRSAARMSAAPAAPRRGQNSPGGRDGRVYVMLHKPARVLATTRDEARRPSGGGGRTTILDLVKHRSGARLYPVGRLDYHSTGLVLLTNDGTLADRLTHARYGVTRTYRVTIKGEVRPDILDDIRRRIGKPAPADSPGAPPDDGGVRIARRPGSANSAGEVSPNTVLEITLREGKSRQLAVILEQMGCMVRRLTRVGIGPLRLRGIGVGEWRDLTAEEIHGLMLAGGLTDQPSSARPRPAAAAPRPRRGRSGRAGPRRQSEGRR